MGKDLHLGGQKAMDHCLKLSQEKKTQQTHAVYRQQEDWNAASITPEKNNLKRSEGEAEGQYVLCCWKARDAYPFNI